MSKQLVWTSALSIMVGALGTLTIVELVDQKREEAVHKAVVETQEDQTQGDRDVHRTQDQNHAMDLQAIRQVVRQEVAAAREQQSPDDHVNDPEDQVQPESADDRDSLENYEESERFSEARSLVDNTISAGVWSEVERSQLRELMGALNDAERKVLMHDLILAANQGELEVTTEGPLL